MNFEFAAYVAENERRGFGMKKGLFAKVSRSFVACALTATVEALSFPLSAFAAGNATLSLRHFTAGSGTVEQGSASMRVFLDSAPGEYTVTDGEDSGKFALRRSRMRSVRSTVLRKAI